MKRFDHQQIYNCFEEDVKLKEPHVDLHISKKKAIIITAAFSFLYLLLLLFSSLSLNTMLGQLHSLCLSSYTFSANAKTPFAEDSYYQINAGISITVSCAAEKSINADILMQTETAEYTDIVSWNTGKLGNREIAISSGIANVYSVKPGDKLYSKHIVDGEQTAYTVKNILSEGTTIRENGQSYSDGIIIMGYDDLYISNISHIAIVYMNGNVDDISIKASDFPVSITFRSDEIATIITDLVPYVVLFVCLAVTFSSCYVFTLTKQIKGNFVRLKMIGMTASRLNQAFNRVVFCNALIAIATATLIALIIALMQKCCCLYIGLLFSFVLIEILSTAISVLIMIRRLWRA